jgi:hypothetical protein
MVIPFRQPFMYWPLESKHILNGWSLKVPEARNHPLQKTVPVCPSFLDSSWTTILSAKLYGGVKWLWRYTNVALGIVARSTQCKRKFGAMMINVSHCQTGLRLSGLTAGCILVFSIRGCFTICLIDLAGSLQNGIWSAVRLVRN